MTVLFAHRGFVNLQKGIRENTIESLNEAVRLGFSAVEFDIWISNSELIINHDDPKGVLEGLPRLEDYFKFGNKLKYWMDFKNIDQNNIDKVVLLLKEAVTTQKIKTEQLYFAPFIEDYDLSEIVLNKLRDSFGSKTNLVALCQKEKDINDLIDFTAKNKIKFASIKHSLINEDLIKKLKDVTIFAWTVNKLEIMKRLESIGIKNFATDKITSDDLNSIH